MTVQNVGPFALFYADPPWQFEIYSEMGAERTPDQHYPTLTDQEIIDFTIGGLTVPQIAHEDAAIEAIWRASCLTRKRAPGHHGRMGLRPKSSATVGRRIEAGLGARSRNRHEDIVMRGTRGNMPGPQYQIRL